MAKKSPNDPKANEKVPEAESTPNAELELEVIKATRPKIILYEDANGESRRVKILPLPAEMLESGAKQLSELARPLINEFLKMSIRASGIENRSVTGAESKGSAPVNPTKMSPKEINELFMDFMSPEIISSTLEKFPEVLEFIIDIGTDIEYDEIKADIFVVIEFVTKIFAHNIGPRLHHFLSADWKRVRESLFGRVGTEPKQD